MGHLSSFVASKSVPFPTESIRHRPQGINLKKSDPKWHGCGFIRVDGSWWFQVVSLVGYAWLLRWMSTKNRWVFLHLMEKKYLGILNEKASPSWCQKTTKIVGTKQTINTWLPVENIWCNHFSVEFDRFSASLLKLNWIAWGLTTLGWNQCSPCTTVLLVKENPSWSFKHAPYYI